MAYHYATPPDEWEFKGMARLPWLAGNGITWKQTQIRDLWPHSLRELFETSSPAGTSTVRGARFDARGSEDKAGDDSQGDAVKPPLGAKVAKPSGQQVLRGLTKKTTW